MIRAAAVLLAASVAIACAGDESVAPTTTASTSATASTSTSSDAATTTAPPDFTGDRDSPFCETVRAAADRPLLDPFEAGLEPDEVELRLRALVLRFDEFAAQAPDVLRDDLGDLVSALADLESSLADFGHDLGAAAEAGVDLSVVDEPRFADVAARLAGYSAQVCERPQS